MTLTLGFSPCPNDTFIFDALVNKKIDTGRFTFEPFLEDVQTLNQWAQEHRLQISKLSFPALFENLKNYRLLQSGSALGKGVGPLLIARQPVDLAQVDACSIAVPGENTTANFLLSFAFPGAPNKQYMLFSEIEDAVAQNRIDLGVIIHENRFTYQQKGLHKVCDLGAIWEEKQQAPIPLGGIAISRTLSQVVAMEVDALIKKSVAFSFAQYPQISAYVKKHAQAMEEDVMRKHIELYVNDYTLDLKDGKKAVEQLYRVYGSQQHNLIAADLF